MPRRRESLTTARPPTARRSAPFAVAIRRTFQSGYDVRALGADVVAGTVVGIVALPLSMALAIAVGVPPQHGLYTAVVGGAIAALTGGSKFQITGPTAAFVVILAPIVAQHGIPGLLTAGLMAGTLMIGMGLGRLGRFVQFIPYPVTTGFTAGIATVIGTLQLKDALGLTVLRMPAGFPQKVAALWAARATVAPPEMAVAAATLALLLLIPRLTRVVPAPLVALTAVTAAVAACGVPVATLGSRFHTETGGRVFAGIPPFPPAFHLPWGDHRVTLHFLRSLLPAAFAIALLGAIESLLSAVVADGMTGKRHDPDAELVGQGLANVVVPFFGGIAATGALARTATGIRAGARSPIAGIVHAAVVLASIVLLAPLVAYVPMAALAALLLLVAWNMAELRHFVRILRVGPRSDVFVLATCYGLTVAFDIVIAVTVGVVFAALLFMNRMAELTRSRVVQAVGDDETSWLVPRGVAVYEIAGALFFGAAEQAMAAMSVIASDVKVVILGLGHVPVIDATGLVALESALDRLRRDNRFVIIAGPLPEPRRIFERAELEANLEHVLFADDVERGLEIANDLLRLNPAWIPARATHTPARTS